MANLSGDVRFFYSLVVHLMLLYTFYQIEMNLRKPADIYRFVTSVGRHESNNDDNDNGDEEQEKKKKSSHQIFTMKQRLFI